ncbi:iron ABC transporter permease (plasmid) [Geminicoccaceae bacterium 1502E]|nr:iron ABC transporter permease [Geminicoccaceae bacterium 1502E]
MLLLPWYMLDDGLFSFVWLADGYAGDRDYAPALFQVLWHERYWLAPLGLFLALPLMAVGRTDHARGTGMLLIAAGAGGLAWLLLQGFGIDHRGVSLALLEPLVPEGGRQYGMGWGASLVALAFLFLITQGLAARGLARGDVFVAGSIGLVVALVAAFIFFPVLTILSSALRDNEGALAPFLFLDKLLDGRIWGTACLTGGGRCGSAWNSLILAVLTGLSTTLLGLAFALVVTRTGFRAKRMLRTLTVLPIITPPFVIGLAIILLFGRSGAVTQFVADLLGLDAGRWVYGLPGILFAQTLAFTPIAFLVLIGVVEGVSPSMEEAAQTLRADPWTTFTTVSLPLMRPGLANAFLLGFIESLADFGNPLVLGGSYDVLATDIFFAIVGAQYDQGRAAVLAIVLLSFTLMAFWAQQRWLGRRSYATVSGKGDSGLPLQLPPALRRLCYLVVIPWATLTAVIYLMILFGGFVEFWGRDHTLTLRHYIHAFSVVEGEHGLVWSGAAWNSFWTTLQIAAISAVPTAVIGLLTAWLLVRQSFGFKRAFEFGTMLSFAIPGTIIGVSYILAFNVPPLELTGTGIILVISFVFRNMPVGVRAGIATMSQLDRSLDEASLTLRANSFTTVRKVILPLLRPAILAALVYSFVRAMTAISAVVFLVSANYEMATTYILGRVENGDYGLAIAYCSVLILVMLASIGLMQWVVGQRRLGRRAPSVTSAAEQTS